jgi:hypothetical protein
MAGSPDRVAMAPCGFGCDAQIGFLFERERWGVFVFTTATRKAIVPILLRSILRDDGGSSTPVVAPHISRPSHL